TVTGRLCSQPRHRLIKSKIDLTLGLPRGRRADRSRFAHEFVPPGASTVAPSRQEPCMSDVPPPRKKKLYIETVGCQMNLLDSELVVGKLRNEGYELTEDIGQA